MPKMFPPGALAGFEPDDAAPTIKVVIRPVVSDFAEKVQTLGGTINLTKGVNALQCYRLIAKIGHSFAMAELGPNAFSPTLINLIRGEFPMYASHYVGSGITEDPSSDKLHEIEIDRSYHSRLIIVRIRLFANLGMPTYYAVAGSSRP